MPRQLVSDAEDNITISLVVSELKIVVTGDANCPRLVQVLCDSVVDREFLSTYVVGRRISKLKS
jgi:hypothetical protein